MNRVQYIFVSSTFSDFHYERDFLNEEVLPKINRKLKAYGYEVCFLDFRWGINDEKFDADSKYFHIINTCIAEVKNSKPFFLLFIGDNTGTMIDKKLVETIYRFNNIDAKPENKSITQMEIDASPIFEGDNSRSFILRRRIKKIADSQKSKFVTCNTDSYVSMLKEKLVHPSNYYEYGAEINDDGKVKFDEEKLANYIVNAVVAQFKTIQAETKTKNIYEQEKDLFSLMIQENDKIFGGRIKEVKILEDALLTKKVVKISGESGIGKTSFMCHVANNLDLDTKHYYFVGDAIGNNDVFSLLNYFIVDLGFKELKTTNFLKLKNYFYNCLNQLDDGVHVFIIDALDRLETYGKTTIDDLFEFERIPNNVKFIISGINLTNSDIKLEEFKKSEIKKVITKRTWSYKKVLPSTFFEMFNSLNEEKIKSLSNPLLLSLAIDSILFITGEDFAKIDVSNYQSSLANVLLEKIGQIKNNPAREFLRRFEFIKKETKNGMKYLNYLACSNNGVSLKEIKRFFKATRIEFDQYEFELIKNSFYSQIILQKNGRYKITHDLFRRTILSTMTKKEIEEIRCGFMLNVLLVDSDNASEYVSQLYQLNNPDEFYVGAMYIISNKEERQQYYDLLVYYFKNEICKKSTTQKMLFKVINLIGDGNRLSLLNLIFNATSDEELYNIYPALNNIKNNVIKELDSKDKETCAEFILLLAKSSLLRGNYIDAINYAGNGFQYIKNQRIGNILFANDFKKILLRSYAEIFMYPLFETTLASIFNNFNVIDNETNEITTYDEMVKKDSIYASIILDLFVNITIDIKIGGAFFENSYQMMYPHVNNLYEAVKMYEPNNDVREMIAVTSLLKLFMGARVNKEDILKEREILLKDYEDNCECIKKERYKIFEILFLCSGLYFTSNERVDRNIKKLNDAMQGLLGTNNFFSITKIIGNSFSNFSLMYLHKNKVMYDATRTLERLQSSLDIVTDDISVYYTLIKVSGALLFFGYYLNNKSLISKNKKIILSTVKFFKQKEIDYIQEIENTKSILRCLKSRIDKDDFNDASNKYIEFLDSIEGKI